MALLNVQSPWHYHLLSLCSLQHLVELVLGSPLHLGSSPAQGWSRNFLSDCGIPLHLLLTPGNGVDISYPGTVSPVVEWAESSCSPLVGDGMMHCPLSAWQLHCMCHTFTTVLFSNAVDFHMAFCVGHWPANLC